MVAFHNGMKILYIANARMPTEKAHGLTIAKSCESFARAGADVSLVLPRRYTHLKGDMFSAYSLERVFNVVRLPVVDVMHYSENRAAYFFYAPTFYASVLLYVLFRSRSSIIYTRDPRLIALSWLRFKVVYECHHVFDKRKSFFVGCRRAYRIVTISLALKNTFVQQGFDERSILVAPSGVDLSTFDIQMPKVEARRALDLPGYARIAIYTGNFTTMGADKGITDIVNSLKHIPNMVFVGAGGNQQDIARYQALAREKGVEKQVLLFGHRTQAELALFQKAADVLLMPFPDMPHYRNNMSPVKMFEYMASGTPIIASDLPTIREVLNEENAYIVPPGDPQKLAQAIARVFEEPAIAQAKATRAHHEVSAYSWRQRAERVLSFIRT
jgi:glycosyltransferase involved in cell wall biosynthesis